MQKSILSILFLILFGQTFAQKGFYIKPAINYLKFYKNNDKGSTFNSKSGTQIVVGAKNFYQGFPDILLGINLGYKTANFFYECGYYSDATSNSIKLSYVTYYPNYNNYYETHAYSIAGVAQKSYLFRMGMKVFEKQSKLYQNITTSIYITSGVEVQINYGTLLPQISEFSTSTDGINEIKITITTEQSIIKTAPKPTIGLLLEIKNKNDFNLFNLTINYNFNLTRYTKWLQTRRVDIEDIDGKIYTVGLFTSTGSGLYLGITKNIYLNRIFKKNKTTTNRT
jgi:hypothetical protein